MKQCDRAVTEVSRLFFFYLVPAIIGAIILLSALGQNLREGASPASYGQSSR